MLKVRCDRSELTECVGDILGIVPTAPAIKPILLNCHLRTSRGTSDESASGESRLEIEVTDLAMAARIRLERAEVLEDGELALPASRFYAIVREVPEKHVVIESLDDQRGAMVRSNGYEFKVLGHDPREFPEVPAFAEKDSLGVPREKFVEILRRVAVAASRDTARFQLNGVFFEVDGDKLLFTATDGKRLTHDYLRIENPNGISSSAIVPNRVVDVLLKILSQGETEFRLAIGDPDIHVSFGRGELTAKLIQGTYPDYHAAIALKANVKVTAKRSDFLNAARSAALMTDKQTATVLFRFEEGKALLNTQTLDVGESRIEVPIALHGEPIEVRFNPTYLIDALRCLTEEEVRIEFFDADKPGTVRGGQHYRHLVMPLVNIRS